MRVLFYYRGSEQLGVEALSALLKREGHEVGLLYDPGADNVFYFELPIFKRLRDERFRSGRGDIAADFKVSAWEAYNAVQGFAQHDMGFRGRDNNSVSGFERILRASNDQHVRKAESLVLDLAV